MTTDDARSDELQRALDDVRARITRACDAAGRDPGEVTLVVVTKTFPACDVALLARLGVVDVGESRDQEAGAKAAELAAGPGGASLRWHFIGQLQRNKARSVARYADVVHSVDRAELAQALDRGAVAAGRDLEVLLQVDLDDTGGTGDADGSAPRRGGADPADVAALAREVGSSSRLVLRGLMAVAPRDGDPAAAFARLHGLAQALREEHPQATWVSAGMSGDLEQAVAAGATHLRVGSAILGGRPPLQ